MSNAVFYPFRVASSDLVLSVDVPGHDVGRASDGSLRVYELELNEIELRASIAVPEVITEVLPPDEHGSAAIATYLVCRSVQSRRRQSWHLGDGDTVEHRIRLIADEWAGELELQAIVVRNRSRATSVAGYASARGSILARSEIRRVLVDPPPLPPGSYLQVRWVDFSEEPKLRPFADHLFALEMATEPELLLNSRIPGAVAVLDSRATTGAIARIRNATNFLIAHQVWSSLLASALDQLSDLARSGEPDPADLQPWQYGILQQWAHALLPEEPAEGALTVLLEHARQGDLRQDLLVRRLPTAIQGKLKTYRGFEDLVREAGAL